MDVASDSKDNYPNNSLLGMPQILLLDEILLRVAHDNKETKTVGMLRVSCKRLKRIITHPTYLREVSFDRTIAYKTKANSKFMSFVEECSDNDNSTASSVFGVITCFFGCSTKLQKGLKAMKKQAGKAPTSTYAYAMLTLHDDNRRSAAELLLQGLQKLEKLQIQREALLKFFAGKNVNLSNLPPIQYDKCSDSDCGVKIISESGDIHSCSFKCVVQNEYETFRKGIMDLAA